MSEQIIEETGLPNETQGVEAAENANPPRDSC